MFSNYFPTMKYYNFLHIYYAHKIFKLEDYLDRVSYYQINSLQLVK